MREYAGRSLSWIWLFGLITHMCKLAVPVVPSGCFPRFFEFSVVPEPYRRRAAGGRMMDDGLLDDGDGVENAEMLKY
jgi:hypothetical protein